MDEELLQLFGRLDDPKWWEAPPGFDRTKATQRVRSFVSELNADLAEPATVETGPAIQDASFHSQVELPGGRLRFSSFGDMVAFTPDHEVPTELVKLVGLLAPRHGYRLIPTEVLELPYTGRNPGVTGIATWWSRFFDWV